MKVVKLFLLAGLAVTLTPVGAVDFAKEIHPILKQNCLACHNSTKAKADLNLENPEMMLKGGETGPAIVPGDADASLLYTTAAHIEEPTMPPKNNDSKARNLNEKELALLKKWIDEGAKGGAVFTAAPQSWKPLTGQQPIYAVGVSPDSRFAVFGEGSQVFVYDLLMKEKVASLNDPGLKGAVAHGDAVQSVAVNDDFEIATGGFRIAKRWARSGVSPKWFTDPLVANSTVVEHSPATKKIAVGAPDGSIRLFDSANPDAKAVVVKDHTAAISSLAFSEDGTSLLSGSADGSVRLRTVADPAKSKVHKPGFAPTAVAMLGGEIFSASPDNKIYRSKLSVFDPVSAAVPTPSAEPKPVAAPKPAPKPAATPAAPPKPAPKPAATPKPAAKPATPPVPKPAPAAKPAPAKPAPAPDPATLPLAGHSKAIKHLAPVPGQTGQLISASDDGSVIIWNLADGKQIRKIQSGVPVALFSVSPDGQRIATSPGKGRLSLWNAADGAKVLDLSATTELERQKTLLTKRVAQAKGLVPGFKNLVTAADKKAADEKEAATKSTAALVEKRAGYETAMVAVRSALAVEALAKRKQASLGEKDPLRAAADKALADAGKAVETSKEAYEKAEREWQVAARNKDHAAIISGKAVEEATAALQQQQVAEAQEKQFQKEIEAIDAEIKKVAEAFVAQTIDFSGDSKYLTVSLPTGDTQVHDGKSGIYLETLKTGEPLLASQNLSGQVCSVVSKSNRLGIFNYSPRWTLSGTIGDGENPEQLPDRVTSLDYSPDGFTLATGCGVPSRAGELKLWSTLDGSLLAEKVDAHRDTVTCVRYSPGGDRIATAASDNLIRIWDAKTLERVGNLEGHSGHVLSIAWHSDQLQIASGSADKSVKIWNIAEASEKSKVVGFEKEVTAVAYQPWTNSLLTGAGDKTVKFANAPLPNVAAFIHCAAVSPDGLHFVAGDAVGNLYHWDSAKKLIKQVTE